MASDIAPLASLQPLQFTGRPLNIQPLAAWNVPSSHPEVLGEGLANAGNILAQGGTGEAQSIAQAMADSARIRAAGIDALGRGISAGADAIGQGIQVAYKSRMEQKRIDAQNKREDTYRQQMEQDRKDALQLRRDEFEHRIETAGGNKGNSRLPPAYSLDGEQSSPDTTGIGDQQHLNDLSQPLDGTQPSDDQLDQQIERMPNNDQGAVTPKTSNLFANLTDPVPASAAPSPTGEMALAALSDNLPENIPTENKSASLGAGAIPSSPAWPSPPMLRNPDKAFAATKSLGGPELATALADVGNYLAHPENMAGSFKTNPAIERIIGVPARVTPEDYQRIVKYANEKGIVAPATARQETSDGLVTLAWPSPDVIEQHAARQEATKERQEVAKERVQQRTQAILNQELNGFNSNNDIKVFTSQNGMRQSFPKFMKDYEAISENPKAAGISDIGLMDMYAKAESGSRVSDSQLHAVLQASTLKQKYETLFNKTFVGGDQLSQAQRDQMAQVLAGDHQAQVEIANQAVHMARNRLIAQGITDEKFLPQPYIPALTKSDVTQQVSAMRDQAIALKQQHDALKAAGDIDGAAKIEDQLEQIGNAAKELVDKKKKAKGFVVNIDDIQNKDQGWGGAAATTLVDHE